MSRQVSTGDRIALRYAIRLKNGTEVISNFDEADADTITVGDGTLAQSLEQWLIGIKPGERHVFLLEPWQAYGSHNDALIQTISQQDIPAGMALEQGAYVEFSLPNGQSLAGTILQIDASGVKVDFNHPLADCPIEFEVEIERIG